MRLFPFALLVSAMLLSQPGLAQNSPQTTAPMTPTGNPTAADLKSGAPSTAATPAATREIAVASLTNKDLKGKDGSDLGGIDRVVESTADKKPYVVVSQGGFLGFFGTRYLLPVEQLSVSAEAVTAADVTQSQMEKATKFVDDPEAYRTIEEGRSVRVPAK